MDADGVEEELVVSPSSWAEEVAHAACSPMYSFFRQNVQGEGVRYMLLLVKVCPDRLHHCGRVESQPLLSRLSIASQSIRSLVALHSRVGRAEQPRELFETAAFEGPYPVRIKQSTFYFRQCRHGVRRNHSMREWLALEPQQGLGDGFDFHARAGCGLLDGTRLFLYHFSVSTGTEGPFWFDATLHRTVGIDGYITGS